MCIVEIYYKDIISFHNYPSTKQGHEWKRTKTKSFVLVEALKRAVWNVLTEGCFNFFFEFFFAGVSLLRPCCLPSYWRGFWIHGRLEGLLAMPHVVLWTSRVCGEARLEHRIASVTVVQTVHRSWNLETQMSLLLISRSLKVIEYASFQYN